MSLSSSSQSLHLSFLSLPCSLSVPYSSVREQKDERRVIGEESIVVTISNPSKRPASACNSLESVPRKRKEPNETIEEAERIPSVIRWKEPTSSAALEEEIRFEPDLNRSPPATSSLKITSHTSPVSFSFSNTGTTPVLSLTSPLHPSSSPACIEMLPVMKRHPDQDERMKVRSVSLDSFWFTHVKCGSETPIKEYGNAIKSKSWSFDDLTCIRKRCDANECAFKSDRSNQKGTLAHILVPGSSSGDSRCRSPSVIIMSSPRHGCESTIDPKKLRRMKKEAIITLWKSSERQLLNSLQDVLQEKRALEQKLLVLQQMLLKPP